MNYWIRKDINFTSYNKNNDDIVILKNSNNLYSEFELYSEFYLKSAEMITECLITEVADKRDISKLDSWFFAVAYLLRQSLELMLKATSYKLGVEHKRIISDMRHDLNIGISILEEDLTTDQKSNTYFKWLSDYFNNISDIDKDSDMFRYPFNSKMETFFDHQIHLDYIAIFENTEKAILIMKALINNSLEEFTSEHQHDPVFLIEGGHYYQQAVIGYKFISGDFYPYIKAYTECANFLHEKIQASSDNIDVFLPMCYLFRNAIELELKNIYLTHCSLQNSSRELTKYKHKLLRIWNDTKQTISEHSNAPEGDTTLEECSEYIRQLNNWDGCSSTFRYPINKHGQFFFNREKRYNHENVAVCFNDICYFLDCVEMQLSHHLEIKQEIEAEYRSYYEGCY